MAQQVEEMRGVAPIGLRLADNHGANLRGIADEQRVPEALHEGVKPDGVASALDTDRRRPRQRGVELPTWYSCRVGRGSSGKGCGTGREKWYDVASEPTWTEVGGALWVQRRPSGC